MTSWYWLVTWPAVSIPSIKGMPSLLWIPTWSEIAVSIPVFHVQMAAWQASLRSEIMHGDTRVKTGTGGRLPNESGQLHCVEMFLTISLL